MFQLIQCVFLSAIIIICKHGYYIKGNNVFADFFNFIKHKNN